MERKGDSERQHPKAANARHRPAAVERREAHASHGWDNPEAKSRSRATVGSRVAGLTLDGGENGGNRGLSADAVAASCMCSCTWLRADAGSIFCAEGADSRLGSIADRWDTSRDSCSVKCVLSLV